MVRDTTAAQVRSEMGLATADGRGSLTVSSTYLVSGRRLVRSPHAGPGGLPGGRGPVTEDHRAGVRVVRGARGRRRFPGAPVRARLPQPGYGHPDASCGLPSRQRSRGRLGPPSNGTARRRRTVRAQLDHQRDHHGSGHGAARRDIAHLQRGRPDQPPPPGFVLEQLNVQADGWVTRNTVPGLVATPEARCPPIGISCCSAALWREAGLDPDPRAQEPGRHRRGAPGPVLRGQLREHAPRLPRRGRAR